MAKLTREMAEEALRLKEEGLGYRKIEKRLKEEYGEDSVPGYSNIYKKIGPVVRGEKTLDEIFPEGETEKRVEKELSKGAELEVGTEEGTEGSRFPSDNTILIVMWVLFAILVIGLVVL
nr:hypothetical protein [uncultured archaeon]